MVHFTLEIAQLFHRLSVKERKALVRDSDVTHGTERVGQNVVVGFATQKIFVHPQKIQKKKSKKIFKRKFCERLERRSTQFNAALLYS